MFLFVCIWLCKQGRRKGGRGISFKACSARCLSNLTHLFHLSLLLSSPHPLPPTFQFCSPLLSVSHPNLRHLSHAASHICQTCIVSPLRRFSRPIWLLHLHHGCCILHPLPARRDRNLEQTEVGVRGASWLNLGPFSLFQPLVTKFCSQQSEGLCLRVPHRNF